MRRFALFAVLALSVFVPTGAGAQSMGCPPPMQFGSRGPNVIRVQQVLSATYAEFTQDHITGYFGRITEAAVKQWQTDNGIVSGGSPATTGWGVVGPITARAMGLCTGTATPPPANPPPVQQSCRFNNMTIAHGSSIKLFQSFSVPFGLSCISEQRFCNNGVLSGSFIYPACSVQSPPLQDTGTTPPPAAPPTPTGGDLKVAPVAGNAPLDVVFSAKVDTAGTYRVDFGDGTAVFSIDLQTGLCSDGTGFGACGLSLDALKHRYATAGAYTAKLLSAAGAVLDSISISVGASACAAPNRDLKLGDEDANTSGQVSVLQRFLARDSGIYPEGLVTGYFGQATEAAVKRFQKAHGITQTGTVGPLTREKMRQVCGGTVTALPGARFAATPERGRAPLTVTFTASGIDQHKDFVYVVDFADGERQTVTLNAAGGFSVKHTYTKAGTYKPRLLEVEYLCGGVSMGFGCDRELQIDGTTVYIEQKIDDGGLVPPGPSFNTRVNCTVRSAFSQSLVVKLENGSTKRFDMAASEGGQHDFTEIFTSKPVSLEIFHLGTGVSQVRLTSTASSLSIASDDSFGDNDFNDLICTVSWSVGGGGGGGGGGGSNLGCLDTPPDQVSTSQTCFNLVGNTITLSVGGGISGPTSFKVSWGDGTIDAWFNTQPVSHTYPSAGTYTVTLSWQQIMGPGQVVSRIATKTVTVGGGGGGGGGGTALGCIDTFGDSNSSLQTCFELSARTLTLRQTAPTNSNPININVRWGDGTQEDWFGTSPRSHTYAGPGTYTVTLTWQFRDFASGTTVTRSGTKTITVP